MTALVRITTWMSEVFVPMPEFAGWLGSGYVSFES